MSGFDRFNQETYGDNTRIQRLKLKRTRKGRLFLTAFCLAVILAALIYSTFVYADDLWTFVAGRYFDNRINAYGTETPPGGQKHWLNILMVGVDQRENEPSRSDTIMVAMINLKDKKAYVISIPRDTRVKIEGFAYHNKINAAHSKGGIELTRKTVEQLLGIPVHNYLETNFNGFENIIDTLGGVSIDVEKRMYYPSEEINLHKGQQNLDGHDALAYVRYRSDGKGDLPRIERQHKFLAALADKLLQPKTILKIPEIAGELHSNVNTDLSVKDFIVLAGELKNIGVQNIKFFNIPGAPRYINGVSYFMVNEEELQVLMDNILKGVEPDKVQAVETEGVPQERE